MSAPCQIHRLIAGLLIALGLASSGLLGLAVFALRPDGQASFWEKMSRAYPLVGVLIITLGVLWL